MPIAERSVYNVQPLSYLQKIANTLDLSKQYALSDRVKIAIRTNPVSVYLTVLA